MDGSLRLMDGEAGPGYEFGRLEIFLNGFWSTICDTESFTPDSAQVACRALGYEGGAALEFRRREPYRGVCFLVNDPRVQLSELDNQVSHILSAALVKCVLCHCVLSWQFFLLAGE